MGIKPIPNPSQREVRNKKAVAEELSEALSDDGVGSKQFVNRKL